jgi:hypothetical protein
MVQVSEATDETADLRAVHDILIAALRTKQAGRSNKAFAHKLRVPCKALEAAKAGGYQLGFPLMFAIARAYPDLETLVLLYLETLVGEFGAQDTVAEADTVGRDAA